MEKVYLDRWIIIHGGKKVGGDYDCYDDAAAAARALDLDVLACLIRQVGANTAIFLS